MLATRVRTAADHPLPAIGAFLDRVESAPDIELHGLVILRHGHVVAAGWWWPYSPGRLHLLYSLTKSFTSTAAGLAAADGLLSLDAPVAGYFPELAARLTDDRMGAMKVRHVAATASGHLTDTWDQVKAADDLTEPVRNFLAIPPDREPGSVFAYNQLATYTLGAIVQRITSLRAVTLSPAHSRTDEWRVRLDEEGSVLDLTAGGEDWAVSQATADTPPTACAGRLLDSDTMRVDVIFLETPHRLTPTCEFRARIFEARWITAPLHEGPLVTLGAPLPHSDADEAA